MPFLAFSFPCNTLNNKNLAMHTMPIAKLNQVIFQPLTGS